MDSQAGVLVLTCKLPLLDISVLRLWGVVLVRKFLFKWQNNDKLEAFQNCSFLLKSLQMNDIKLNILTGLDWKLRWNEAGRSRNFFVKILFELSSIYVPLLLNSLIVVTLVAAGWWNSDLEFIKVSDWSWLIQTPSNTSRQVFDNFELKCGGVFLGGGCGGVWQTHLTSLPCWCLSCVPLLS